MDYRPQREALRAELQKRGLPALTSSVCWRNSTIIFLIWRMILSLVKGITT